MNKPYASTTKLYAMMASPTKREKIREYIESLEERVHVFKKMLNEATHDLSDCEDEVDSLEANIPNKVAQDVSLSYAALGLYVYMKSLPDDEEYARRDIYRDGTGEKGWQNLIKELENAGLLVQE